MQLQGMFSENDPHTNRQPTGSISPETEHLEIESVGKQIIVFSMILFVVPIFTRNYDQTGSFHLLCHKVERLKQPNIDI